MFGTGRCPPPLPLMPEVLVQEIAKGVPPRLVSTGLYLGQELGGLGLDQFGMSLRP